MSMLRKISFYLAVLGIVAAAVTAKRLADGLDIGTELQRDRANNRGVAGGGIGGRTGFVVCRKDFAQASIGKPRNRRLQTSAFDRERLAAAAIR